MTPPPSDSKASSGQSAPTLPPCGLVRRLCCMVYDGMLLLGVLFVGAMLALLLTGGEAVPADNLPFKLWLLGLAWGYFAYPWTRAGQTLGMRAWRVRLQGLDAEAAAPVGWRRATLRFFLALLLGWLPLGLGFLWSLVDRRRLAWHDRASGTGLVVEPRRPRRRAG